MISYIFQNPFQRTTIMTFWKSDASDDGFHYWGGVPFDPDTYDGQYAICACGLTDSCVEPGTKCNCDQTNDTIDDFFQDDGYLEYKAHLPVTVFKAGDTGTVFSITGTIW